MMTVVSDAVRDMDPYAGGMAPKEGEPVERKSWYKSLGRDYGSKEGEKFTDFLKECLKASNSKEASHRMVSLQKACET